MGTRMHVWLFFVASACGQNIQTWLSPRNSTRLSLSPSGASNRLFYGRCEGPTFRNAGVVWTLAGLPVTG
jgi:hypothetical protein